MGQNELGRAIREGAARYATLVDQPSRTTVRATVLHQLDQLKLPREALVTRRVSPAELRADPVLRGAAVIHFDLVFRSSVSVEEVIFTANTGLARVAYHPQLPDFPIGVALAQPTRKLVRVRAEIFERDGPAVDEAPVLMPYAVAASPGRKGAGAALLRAILADAGALPSPPRVVTFSPLTGMRARVIRLVDDGAAWSASAAQHPGVNHALVREQLLALLGCEKLPDELPQPARGWLATEGARFAESPSYAVGCFHRAMGATLVGLTDGADPWDSDALWARAYFDYGVPGR